MTQALAAQQWCRRFDHQVVGVLAGLPPSRSWPAYFEHGFDVPVTRLVSPAMTYRSGRSFDLPATLWSLVRQAGAFRRSVATLRDAVRRTQPDLIVNFLEPIVGLAGLGADLGVPVLSVGHHFMLRHPAFPTATVSGLQTFGLHRYVDFAGRNSVHYGLSFYEAGDLPAAELLVGPPLLRDELLALAGQPAGDHLLVYLLNAGYRSDIERWHRRRPEVPLHVFYDRAGAPEEEAVDSTLTFHRLNAGKFLRFMATARGVACTAGFESVCEAAWLGKPVLAVPVQNHVEQQLNAVDAEDAGIATGAGSFELDRLLEATSGHAHERFQAWVAQSDLRFLRAIHYTVSSRRNRISPAAVPTPESLVPQSGR